MKSIIRRIFSRKEDPSGVPHSVLSSEMTTRDLADYYLRVVSDCLRRLLVPADSVEVRVRQAGSGPTGLPGFIACVRVLRWDPVVTPVLLQNMPVLDARVRLVVQASVILEHTYFGGLWFQAGAGAPGAPQALLGLPAELRYQTDRPIAGA